MGMITALFDNSTYSLEEAFRATDCTSDSMRNAIREWFSLYFNDEVTKEEDPCMRMAYTVVNKLVKTAFGEYSASTKDTFAAEVLDKLNDRRKAAVQKALIGGVAYLRPVPMYIGKHYALHIAVVGRDNVMIFGKDVDGSPTDIGMVERTTEQRWFYTLIERRTVGRDGRLTIRYALFRAHDAGMLGEMVPLNTLPKYEGLVPEYTFPRPLSAPLGMVGVRTPMVNCVDGGEDPVSVYAPAVGLIHNINRNEAQINGEFERGQSRAFVSSDLLKKGKSGEKSFEDTLFVGLDDDPDTVGVTIFSPALREASYLSRKQDYLRAVETVIGLKRGLISEVEAAERTATEITSSAGDYNLTIIDFQEMWETALKAAVKLCGELGVLYKVPGAHEITDDDAVTVDWGNGILYDEDKTWADYQSMVSSNLLKPEIALGWRFGMPTETPEDLAAIREKYMPGVDVTEDEDVDE